MDKKRIAAAYIRVSTDDQTEYSPDSQIKLIRDYGKKHGFVVPDEYIFRDDGISGRSAAKRPAFQLMIAAAKEKPRPFETILVWKFSRFARNQEESIVYKSLLKKENNIDVVSISEPLMEGPFGELIERIIEWFDAFYSLNLATEVRRGMTERVQRGGTVSVAPFGYRYQDRQLVIEPEKAEIVRMVYADFLSGVPILTIAKKINAMGIKTNRGNAWENRTVRYMLTNPTYAGKVRWSAKGLNDYHKTDGHTTATMIVDGTHEPIISPNEFEAAQQKIQKYVDGYRSKSDLVARREHGACMLQGIVKCSACGGTLSRASYIYFNCVRYVHGKCSVSHSISIAEAEKMILWAMHQQFDALDFTFAPRENTQVQAEKEAILSQIRHEQEMLARCKEAYIAGVDTLAEYSDNKSAAKAKIERLQNQLSELHEPEKIDGTAFAAKHREALQILDDPTVPGDEKSRVIRTFVDHIVFYRSTKSFKIIYKA